MAKDVVEFSLQIEKISFTFKGAREKGEALGQELNRLVGSVNDLQRQALSDSDVIDAEPARPAPVALPAPARTRRRRRSSGANSVNGSVDANGGGEEGASRRSTGASPKRLLLDLRRSGFFREARGTTAIVAELHTRGFSSIRSTDLTSTLTRLTQQQILARQKDDKSNWLYADGSAPVPED